VTVRQSMDPVATPDLNRLLGLCTRKMQINTPQCCEEPVRGYVEEFDSSAKGLRLVPERMKSDLSAPGSRAPKPSHRSDKMVFANSRASGFVSEIVKTLLEVKGTKSKWRDNMATGQHLRNGAIARDRTPALDCSESAGRDQNGHDHDDEQEEDMLHSHGFDWAEAAALLL